MFPFGNQNIVVSYAHQKYFHAISLRMHNKLGIYPESNRNTKRRKKSRETDSDELKNFSKNFDDQNKSLKIIYSTHTARVRKSLFGRFKAQCVCTLKTVRNVFGGRNNNTANILSKQLCTSTCKIQNIICFARRRSVQCLHPCTSKTCIISKPVQKIGSGTSMFEKIRRRNKYQSEPCKVIMPYSSKNFHRYMSDIKIAKRRKLSKARTLSRAKRDKASQVIYYSDSGTDTKRQCSNKKM